MSFFAFITSYLAEKPTTNSFFHKTKYQHIILNFTVYKSSNCAIVHVFDSVYKTVLQEPHHFN
jgi:hypothetical protein